MHVAPLLIALVACDRAAAPEDSGAGGDSGEASRAGRCDYVNPFSDGAECKDYVGTGWSDATAAADCATPMPGATAGTYTAGATCPRDSILGECFVADGSPEATILVFPGTDAGDCGGVELGCTFASGTFVPSSLCLGGGGDTGAPPAGSVFQPFARVCVDPLPGEPAGASDGGQVCTWEAISGATEEGRRYVDYASCEPVLTQRPYWPATVTSTTPSDDPRLSDTAWVAEYAWATEQVESTGCVCCHSSEAAPSSGPSGWYLEAGPIWLDTLDDDGLAVMAGWVDSSVFGAFPAADNNGFHRDTTGVPTTDPARMQAFLAGELARRGLGQADFTDTAPFGGPLYDQLIFTPSACPSGVGIDADGVIRWTGGGARYVYVLSEGSDAPGVPPNLDLPDGTVWRVDVPPDAAALGSGEVTYGTVPSGARQAFPETGAPASLEAGTTYYLYVLRDIYQPLARCLFTAGG